jgi:hypothetical protein
MRSRHSSPPYYPATAADLGLMTAPAWPVSSTSCAPVFPGGCRLPASWAAAARSPAGGVCATGSAPASGSSCTTPWSTNSAATASSTGPALVLTRSAFAPSAGLPNWPEPDRPRQARLQGPPAGRPPGPPPLAVCLSAANTHDSLLLEAVVDAVPAVKGPRDRPGRLRKRPAKLHLARPTTTRAAGGRCANAASPRRIARRGVGPRQARPPPVGRGAVAGVAAGLPAPAGPLRAARRHPAWVRAAGVGADLPQAAEQAEALSKRLRSACR